MLKRFLTFSAAFAAVATLAWASTASAGIIVTVGKFSATAEQGDDTTRRPCGGPAVGDNIGLPDAPMPDPEPTPAELDEAAAEEAALHYDEMPEDFGCRSLGGGLVYCEGEGAGPGAGAGGGLDDAQAMDDDEIVVMGCQAGSGSAAPLWGALVLLLGFALRRRRSASI